jgi:hypothetical protein
MRALHLCLCSAFLLLPACGDDAGATLAAVGPRVTALENGAAADALIGQLSERGSTSARTDAGSFAPVGVAVGIGSARLYVVDALNKRVLGWPDTAALASSEANGSDAALVLNQDDMSTSDFRNIPVGQQIAIPVGVAVDHGQRLYVYDDAKVIVFADPFAATSDVVADYKLTGVPANIRAVRALGHGKVAVVGVNEIVFYEQGAADPYAQATLAAPCLGQATDITQTTGGATIFYVSCSGPLLCSDAVTTACSQVFVYAVDPANGLPLRAPGNGPPQACLAYNDFIGITSIDAASQRLMIADSSGNRLVLWDTADVHASGLLGATPTPCVGTQRLPGSTPTAIYGQPNASSLVANYSSTGSRIWEGGLSGPSRIAIDPDDDRLWVVDSGNNRVLGFGAVTGGSPERSARVVLGQLDMTHAFVNRLEPDALAAPGGVALGPEATVGSNVRAAVVDSGAHRVLIFNNINSYVTGGDPSLILGQLDGKSYLDQGTTPLAVSLASLSHPTYAAIAPNGAVYVADNGNARVLAYDSLGTSNRPNATRVFGATTGTAAGLYGSIGPLAATNDHVFVAAGNRIFMWAAASPRLKPIRVFGQVLTAGDTPLTDDIDNLANRGLGIARADTLNNVTGLAIDSSGTLWVADSGNRRILWFDSPTDSNATAATTADGVVGQPDFASTSAYGGVGLSRYGFSGLSGIAIADDGTLWAADSADARVLVFFDPRTPDPVRGMPAANMVLGQDGFESRGDNNTLNGVNARTMSGPVSVAVDKTGRTALVTDAANFRVLRFIENRAPVVTGGGTFEVIAGETGTVILGITDPDNDSVTTALIDPVPAGATLTNNAVHYAAPADAPAGTTAHVVVAAVDGGPRAQTTTVSVNFRVVARSSQIPGGTPAPARPPREPQGCRCAGSDGSILAFLAFLPLLARRRWR